MKYRNSLTSIFVAALVLASLQIPSNAHMPGSLSMATGMSKVQIQKMYDTLGAAISRVSTASGKAADAGKTVISETTLTRTGTVSADDRFTCNSGGYIGSKMTSTTVFTKSNSNISIKMLIRQTVSNWKCITGWTVNGNLNLDYKISGSSTSSTSNTSGTANGSWKSVGPKKVKQSCVLKGSVQDGAAGANPTQTIRVTCVPGGVTTFTEKL